MISFSKIVIALAVTVACVQAEDLGETCVTDGGYVTDKACVGACRDYETDAPFQADGDVLIEPTTATNDTWCAIVNNYALTGGTKKQWGFCLCTPNTASPTEQPTVFTPEPVFLAANGWLTEETDCVFGTITPVQGEGAIAVSECLPVENYSLYIVEDSNKWNGNPDNNTMWCPTASTLRLHLNGDNSDNRPELRSWGYCTETETSRAPTQYPTYSPTTPQPSMSPTTSEPTMEPTTLYPSTSPTQLPTPFTPEQKWFASEAWVGDEVECVLGEIQTEAEGNFTQITGCLPMEGYDLFINEDSAQYTVSSTNNTMWCPTIDVFKTHLDSSVSSNKDILKSWGFCTSSYTSRSPTTAPTPWVSETLYYATGGGVGIASVSTVSSPENIEPCIIPFTVKGEDDVVHTSCLEITDSVPNMAAFSGLPDYPREPEGDINKTHFCPIGTTDDNNYNGDGSKGKYEKWGYCFEVQTTREPTLAEVTNAPTQGTATGAPVTASPTTMAPTTSAPTDSIAGTARPSVSPTTAEPTLDPTTESPTAAGSVFKPNFFVAIGTILLFWKL